MTRSLAVRLDSDGDVLLTGSAVRAMAAQSSSLTFLASSRGANAAALLPGVDDVLVFDAPWVLFDPPEVNAELVNQLVDIIRRREFDKAVIFSSFHQSPLPVALLLRMAGVAHISAVSVDYPGSLLDVRLRFDDQIHEVERNLSLVQAAGFDLAAHDTALGVRQIDDYRVPMNGPYVVVHPGAAVPARAWSPSLHKELVALLVSRGHSVVVTGGPKEVELATEVAGEPSASICNLAGKTTLEQLASVLSSADAVIVGNTGPAHLAAAVGTPVVSLFAATVSPKNWRPWGVPHVILGDFSSSCAGSRARQCPVVGHPCINSVAPQDVLEALDKLLASSRVA